MTPEQAAKVAGVDRTTILIWLKRYDLGDQKPNGRWEIDGTKLAHVIAIRNEFYGRRGKKGE